MTESADVPVLHETPGGWLATSPGDFPRVGVIAATSTEAEREYRAVRATWREWRALAKQEVAAE